MFRVACDMSLVTDLRQMSNYGQKQVTQVTQMRNATCDKKHATSDKRQRRLFLKRTPNATEATAATVATDTEATFVTQHKSIKGEIYAEHKE